MAEYVTRTPVNVAQLSLELGGLPLRTVTRDGTTTIRCDIDDKQLATAVVAHKADPLFRLPETPLPPTESERMLAALIDAQVIEPAVAAKVLRVDMARIDRARDELAAEPGDEVKR